MKRKRTDNKSFKSIGRESLVARAAHVIAERIVQGDLSEGDLLPPEHELCEQMGIGRSTLREAVKVLESKGLLRRSQGVGVEVVDECRSAASELLSLLFSRAKSPVKDLLEARRLFEVQQAVLAAERADDDDLKDLQAAMSRMKIGESTTDQCIEADLDFHFILARATHNEVLLLLAEALRPLIRKALRKPWQQEYLPETVRHHHEEILWAVRRHNPQQAADAMTRHMR